VERGNCSCLFVCATSHDAPVSPVLRRFVGTLCIGMASIRYLGYPYGQLRVLDGVQAEILTTAFVSLWKL